MTIRPRVYLASPLGFVPYGARFADEVGHLVHEAGLEPLDPFTTPEAGALGRLLATDAPREAIRAANQACGRSNAAMIEAADGLLACLDGVAVDDGVAGEIGYAAHAHKAISGYRLDLRVAGDNVASIVNLQIESFIEMTGGSIHRSVEDAIDELRRRLLG